MYDIKYFYDWITCKYMYVQYYAYLCFYFAQISWYLHKVFEFLKDCWFWRAHLDVRHASHSLTTILEGNSAHWANETMLCGVQRDSCQRTFGLAVSCLAQALEKDETCINMKYTCMVFLLPSLVIWFHLFQAIPAFFSVRSCEGKTEELAD